MSSEKILFIDDDVPLLDVVAETLKRAGYEVDTASNAKEAQEKTHQTEYDLFILDFKMPDMNGIELMKILRRIQPSAEAIIITGYATVEKGVEAIKEGARDYLCKPMEGYELQHRVNMLMERRRLHLALKQKDRELQDRYHLDRIAGVSEAMRGVRDMAARSSALNTTVLIEGQSGTGKDLVAQAIHYSSERASGPFIAVNCGAIASHLAERELFGHEKGAFTGAIAERPGYFEAATGGTLFLDEIGELPLDMQVKLLRALDNQEIMRVGGTKTVSVNARMIFATNRDLHKMVEDGTFRHDLLYRINVIQISIPPLHERREDIPLLVTTFITRVAERLGIEPKAIDEEAMAMLEDYDWPGNARELENVIERAMALSRKSVLRLEDLPGWVLQNGEYESREDMEVSDFMAARRQAQERFDKKFLVQALKNNNGNVSQTAKEIGLARSALQRFMRKYGIERETTVLRKK